MPNPFLSQSESTFGDSGYLPLPPLPPLPAPTPLYVPAPPVPTPVAPPPPPRPVAQVPTITAPTFQTIAPSTVVRGSYADAATQLRKARVQASIDSRADLRTLQARLRELMEMQSNAKQLRARQIASHAESVGSVADKDLQQAMKLADKEIKELEKRISKARSLEEPTSAASSAVENGNRAMKNALDLFEHRYDTAGEEPIAPFGGPAVSLESAHTAAEWVDQNWRQQKIQVRDSFGVKRLMTAEEIMNDPDIRMSNSQVKALAREKAEAEWDIRHAPAVQRSTPGGPAPGPVAGGVFVEALTAFHQVAQTARAAPTVSDVEDYAVAQETSVPTIEEAEARMPFSPYVSRQAVAFEAGPESVIPSVPSFPGAIVQAKPPITKIEQDARSQISKEFSDWKIPEMPDLGITEATTADTPNTKLGNAQFREMSRVLSWASDALKVAMKKGEKKEAVASPFDLETGIKAQVKADVGDEIKRRYAKDMYTLFQRTMNSSYTLGARYMAARQLADLLRSMEADTVQLTLQNKWVQYGMNRELAAQEEARLSRLRAEQARHAPPVTSSGWAAKATNAVAGSLDFKGILGNK